jgi:hypothetical protein
MIKHISGEGENGYELPSLMQGFIISKNVWDETNSYE